MRMKRVSDGLAEVAWLGDSPGTDGLTGYAPRGWPASTWVLHAMYRDLSSTAPSGTHDEEYRRQQRVGDAEALMIGDLDLDAVSTVTGVPLGLAARPGREWERVRWSQYAPADLTTEAWPPCFQWFDHKSWPAAIQPPPEGSLDWEGLHALLDVLGRHTAGGPAAECLAYFAPVLHGDYDAEGPHVWRGPLASVVDLVFGNEESYEFSPSNLWPVDRSWLVCTDYDMLGTQVCGTDDLIASVTRHPELETVSWPRRGPG